jgi:hypothetical protein
MSNIIQQMDPRLNPQVVTNDYDLVDPNGNVILPLLWDAVVQDGTVITLRPKQPVVVPPGMLLVLRRRILAIDAPVEVQQLQTDVQQLQPQVQALQQLRPQVQALQQLQPQVQALQQGMERMERRVRNANQKRISILRWFTT